MTDTLSRHPNSLAAKGRELPRRRDARQLQAAGQINPDLFRILRRQTVGNWMLPSMATLTPQYIENILRGALGGNHVQQWELFDLMLDTWPRLLKNTSEITGAVQAMQWKLEAWAEDDQPPSDAANERKKVVSSGLWQMRPELGSDDNGFETTIGDLCSAWWVGTVVLEIVWESRRVGQLGDLTVPQCTAWAHPRNYGWNEAGQLGLNLNAENSAGIFAGSRARSIEPFPENKFLVGICKAKSGPAQTAARLRGIAWWWCAANFSADWLMNLAQLFGIPFRWATYADNAKDGTIDLINDLLDNMGSSGRAAFPEGTNLNFLEAGKNAGSSPQADLLERADKACDLLILGQTLTTDVGEGGGGSLALGKVHGGVRSQVMQSAANFVARVLNEQFVPAILRENFGDEAEAPYFCPEPRTEKDLKSAADVIASAVSTGLAVPKKWAHEELNIPLPQAGEEIIERQATAPLPGGPGAPMPADSAARGDTRPASETETETETEIEARRVQLQAANADRERLVAALAEKIDPVAKILNRIAEIKDDAALLAALQNLYAEMPALTALVTADVSRQQRALEKIIAPALAAGLEGKSA